MQQTVHRSDLARVHAAPVGDDQLHITASIAAGRAGVGPAVRSVYDRVAGLLAEADMKIVHERIFGGLAAQDEALAVRDAALASRGLPAQRPITYVQGGPLGGEGVAGVQIHALRPPDAADQAWIIDDGGAVCGHGWTRHGTMFLLLQDLHGLGGSAPGSNGRLSQAERMFERARRVLGRHGAGYDRVVRTWIYVSKILDWYGDFNRVRNAAYRRFGLIGDRPDAAPRLPASTGIEGDNPLGAACVMDLLAVIPNGGLDVEPMASTRQNDAYRYGSAFSRGMCVREPDVTHLMVSGTAAIDEAGRSVCQGDPAGQVRRTIENVEALIAARGASLADVVEATAFLKRPEDEPVYRQVTREMGLADLPAVVCRADVCRDELLFELDALVAFTPRT